MWKLYGLLAFFSLAQCGAITGSYVPIEALNNVSVLCNRYKNHDDVFVTLRDTTIELHGMSYFLPKGTIVDNGDLGGLVFPRETEVPVGPNLVPFAPHEHVFMYFNDSVRVQSGVLGHDVALQVGARTIPFEAARNTPESKRWRGEYQIGFHNNGTVSEAFINDTGVTLTIAGQQLRIPGGAMIRFHENGAIQELPIFDNAIINVGRNRIAGTEQVHYSPSEVVRAITFAGTRQLRVGDTVLTFTASGGSYAHKRFETVDGSVMFHEDGTVSWGVLSDTTTFLILGRRIQFVPQGVHFDSLGRVELLAYGNEILRYKTLTPLLDYHDKSYLDECVECQPDSAFGAINQGRLQCPTTFKIGGNNLTFSRRSGIGNPGLGRGTITGSLVPGQNIRVGVNTVRVWDLAPVSGAGDIFFGNGVPMGVKLYEDCDLRVGSRTLRFRSTRNYPNVKLHQEADIGFHFDGSVAFGVVAEPMDVSLNEREPAYLVYQKKFIRLQPDQQVYFHRDGSVKFILQNYNYLVLEYATDRWAPEHFEPLNFTSRIEFPTVRFDTSATWARHAGSIKVTATDKQEVYLDGRLMGKTPLVVTDLPAGGHRVALYDDAWLANQLGMESGRISNLSALALLQNNLPGTRDSMAALPSTRELPRGGVIAVNVPRNETLQIHYQFDYRAGTMEVYYFNANPLKCIAVTDDHGILTNLGWLMLSDFSDTLGFALYTEEALRRQKSDGVINAVTQANKALLTLLRGDSAAATRQYNHAIANADDPQEFRQAICADFDEIDRLFPEREPYIFWFRNSMGFCESASK